MKRAIDGLNAFEVMNISGTTIHLHGCYPCSAATAFWQDRGAGASCTDAAPEVITSKCQAATTLLTYATSLVCLVHSRSRTPLTT